jgi:class 3 adenylate cyclase
MNATNETVFLIADLAGFTALTEAHGDMSAVNN